MEPSEKSSRGARQPRYIYFFISPTKMPSGTLDPLAGESRADKPDLGHFVLGDPMRLTGLRKKSNYCFLFRSSSGRLAGSMVAFFALFTAALKIHLFKSYLN